MSNFHTVVIGGGVVGTAVAYYLAKQGRQVTLLEQGELCSGCSHGNAGQITPGHLPLPQPGTMRRNLRWLFKPTSPLFVAPRFDLGLLRWLWQFNRACNQQHLRKATKILCELGAASEILFAQLQDEIQLEYENQGRLEVCGSEKTLLAAIAESKLLEECGFESLELSGTRLQEFEPAIQADVAGAVYYPNSGSCNPHSLVDKLACGAKALGATIKTNTRVTDLSMSGHRLDAVHTEAEEISADSAVLACGSWTPPLARQLGLRVPVQPGKGYHLDIDRTSASPTKPIVLVDERIFVTPIDDFLRFAGTMEFSGFNLRQRPARLEMLASGASRYFSGVRAAKIKSRWCHLRPMTPDGLPILGPAPNIDNVWIAAGHGMLGLTQGPITGKLIAESICDGRTSIDLSELRPERFR